MFGGRVDEGMSWRKENICKKYWKFGGWGEDKWIPADCFADDVKTEGVIQYFIKESLEECLAANEYEVLEENPLEKK